ncbi:MAG: hypothetical protein WDW38_005474 [Sanguina aurantia]
MTLGIPSCDGARMHQAFSQAMPDAMQGITPPPAPLDTDGLHAALRMEWGTGHEPNGIQALLENADAIPCMAAYRGLQMRVYQRGMHTLDPASLPSAVLEGVAFHSLPLLGSSPDAEIQFHDASDSVLESGLDRSSLRGLDPRRLGPVHGGVVKRMAVEVKAPCPFYPMLSTGGAGKGRQWYVFRPRNAVTSLSPTYFVQCQAHMLVLGVDTCVFVSHGAERANVFEVPLDVGWCNMMLRQLQQVGSAYLAPGLLPPGDFGDALGGRAQFLGRTVSLCQGCKVDARLEGVRGPDGLRFHDHDASPASS